MLVVAFISQTVNEGRYPFCQWFICVVIGRVDVESTEGNALLCCLGVVPFLCGYDLETQTAGIGFTFDDDGRQVKILSGRNFLQVSVATELTFHGVIAGVVVSGGLNCAHTG